MRKETREDPKESVIMEDSRIDSIDQIGGD